MRTKFQVAAYAVTLLVLFGNPAVSAKDPVFEEVIRVHATRDDTNLSVLSTDDAGVLPTDTANLVSRLKGASLINNGALSGQVSWRGLFGTRVGVSIDGQRFHSGGPNLMDPPLHYAPLVLIDRIEVSRGPAQTSFGPALGGSINAELKQLDFGVTSKLETHYDVTMIARSVNHSFALGGVTGLANDRYKIQALFSREQGDDFRFPGGSVASSSHERNVYGLSAATRRDNSVYEIEIRRHETGPTGNPPFAMDIEYVDTDFAKFAWTKEGLDTTWTAMVGYTDVDHAMNNYALRTPPASTSMYRRTLTGARTLNASLGFETETRPGKFGAGIDTEMADKFGIITNPGTSGFYLPSLAGIEMDRTGLWLQWAPETDHWNFEFGTRLDHYKSNAADAITGPAVPAMPAALAASSNLEDKSRRDTTLDSLARGWISLGNATYRLAYAHKNRVPGHVELYAWLPTPASGGLADGNTYVGDVRLEVETANTLELGVDYRRSRWFVRPAVHVSYIDDYITGVPFDDSPGIVDSMVEMVSSSNGDPTPLRFANVDAMIYGVEANFGVQLTRSFDLEGNLAYLRGKRRDINDALYRMAPPNAALALNWHTTSYGLRTEAVYHAAQDKVSVANDEIATGDHLTVNLHSYWESRSGLRVSLGIENLFDQQYLEHLSGYNRIMASDVGLGERLPGASRNVYVQLQLKH